jgi:hypothetical protein
VAFEKSVGQIEWLQGSLYLSRESLGVETTFSKNSRNLCLYVDARICIYTRVYLCMYVFKMFSPLPFFFSCEGASQLAAARRTRLGFLTASGRDQGGPHVA